jgi:hypothetical protein
MTTTPKPLKLTRKQIQEGLEQIPLDQLFHKNVSKQLTAKQKGFALDIAKGATGSQAYRNNYDTHTTKQNQGNQACRLTADDRIKAEIAAYALAIEAEKHRSPAALRALVIQSLVQVVIDPDAKQATKVAAAKVLGTVTEVAAFTERKEVRTITSSEDARAKVMGELRRLMGSTVEDARIIDEAADSLLDELSHKGNVSPVDEVQDSDEDEDPPIPHAPVVS